MLVVIMQQKILSVGLYTSVIGLNLLVPFVMASPKCLGSQKVWGGQNVF